MERLKRAFAAAKAELFEDHDIMALARCLAEEKLKSRDLREQLDAKESEVRYLERRAADLERVGEENLEEGLREQVLALIELLDLSPNGSLKELIHRSIAAVAETVKMNGVLRDEITKARTLIDREVGASGMTLLTHLETLLNRHYLARMDLDGFKVRLDAAEAKNVELVAEAREAARVLSNLYPDLSASGSGLSGIIQALERGGQTDESPTPPPWDAGASVVEYGGSWWGAGKDGTWHGPYETKHDAQFTQSMREKYTVILDPEEVHLRHLAAKARNQRR